MWGRRPAQPECPPAAEGHAPPRPLSAAAVRHVLSETWTEWNLNNATRLGAALAYYTVLSIAPLLVIVIAIAGLAFGREAAQGHIYWEIRDLVGPDGARAIQAMIEGASKPASGIAATLLGFLMLAFAATSVVAELRSSLNVIWNVPAKAEFSLRDLLLERSNALVVVLGCGFLLLVSLIISAGLAAVGEFAAYYLPASESVLQWINFAVSLAVITGIFAVLFKFLPEVSIHWRDVLLGAGVTALLFSGGKFLIGLYLGKASFGSTYGAAGSLLMVLVWVYYSSQIFFFGAEFTQVFARDYGSDPCRLRGASKHQTSPAGWPRTPVAPRPVAPAQR